MMIILINMDTTILQTKISYALHQVYKTGDRVTNKELKATLQKIYTGFGCKRKAKGTQITEYGFATQRCKIPTDKGRKDGMILFTT